jgi:hypothetical protein
MLNLLLPDVGRLIRLSSDGDRVGSRAMSSGEHTMQKARCDLRPGHLHTLVRLRFMSRLALQSKRNFWNYSISYCLAATIQK